MLICLLPKPPIDFFSIKKRSGQKKTNWDGLDGKAFAGIYKLNWVCSANGRSGSFLVATSA
jgi:hypothetical protein